MRYSLSTVFTLLIVTSSTTWAGGLAENFVHPDKQGASVAETLLGLDLDASTASVTTVVDPCADQCSATCISFAQTVLSQCGSVPRPRPGPGPIPMPPNCIEDMRSFFAGRSGTSSDQDRSDAIAYCTSGADPACAPALQTNFTSKRTGTSSSQDRTDAAYACQNGATVSCVQQVFEEYRRRSGTSSTQDINDSLAACQRRAFPRR